MPSKSLYFRGDVGDPGPEGLIGAKGEPGRDGLPGHLTSYFWVITVNQNWEFQLLNVDKL